MIEVRPVATVDTEAMRAWYDVVLAAEAGRPLPAWPSFETAMRVWSVERDDLQDRFLVAELDGVPVGAGRLTLHLRDNTHLAVLKVFVDPPRRRGGVGTALLAALEELAAAHGRGTLLTEVTHPPGQPGAGAAFAAARGYAVAGREVLKAADLTTTADRWPGLAERAAARSEDYRLVWWTDTTPEEHLDSLAHLFSRFLDEIPLGDVDVRPQAWDADRVREGEERRRRSGIRPLTVAAVAPDGSLAGYTTLVVHAGDTHAGIESTLVLPEHRGHSLGLAMKVLLHQQLVDLVPEATLVVTGNAGVNRWMNAVNADLGYRDLEECLEVQKLLDPTPGGTP
ncbi:GNAT family N-acetyltransferase [Nocardioides rubriscoriae]|uniref:GNAT family N-acetyltransferase n=1 Tax=Nocardioides rubriscoriae TaxID=642762 RepID=UPI0011E0061D|nr:GNAT family N-acetyltransferase [Nocardioides rubriscoriae]